MMSGLPKRLLLALAAVGVAAASTFAQAPTSQPTGEGSGMFTTATSAQTRDLSPQVDPQDMTSLVQGDSAFALSLYGALRGQDGNLFFSPHSLSTALAMTWAGAHGETADQMASALHLDLPPERLHDAMDALDLALASRAETVPLYGREDQTGDPFTLHVVNALWGQEGDTFLPDFLDRLARSYGADLKLLDFLGHTEEARQRINQWVSDQTAGKIPELLAQGVLDATTRLVLTNAVYFKASWAHPFDPSRTRPRPFHALDGQSTDVPMMDETTDLGYARADGVTAVELPYLGNTLSMVVLMPDAGTFEAFESRLDAGLLASIGDDLESQRVHLVFPKFTFRSSFDLAQTLAGLGMPDAFQAGLADFSGMDGSHDLYIGAVVHQAYVAVDEQGTEAAAATAVVMMRATALPREPVDVVVDRPFIFYIRDIDTGAILFLGRMVAAPSAE